MKKAIHLINEREGLTRKGLSKVASAQDTWRSCCWVLSEFDQDALLGGWLYLHDSKGKPASLSGRIIGFEAAEREGTATQRGVAIVFQAHRDARGKKWRGASHGMAWSSGVIEADLSHEQD
jgi:hypothetical protein